MEALEEITRRLDRLVAANEKHHDDLREGQRESQRQCAERHGESEQAITELRLTVKELRSTTQEMRRLLVGNGEVGAFEQLRELRAFLRTVRRVFWIIVPIILSLGLSGLAALAKTLIAR